MAKIFLYFSFSLFFITLAMADYNVLRYGAKNDGKTDSTKAFLNTWDRACSSTKASTIWIPKGRYLINAIVFRGPCKKRITFKIDGTIIAPNYRSMGNSGYWVKFIQVNGLSVYGGTFDAKGAAFWACKKSGKSCPVGARSITFNWIKNLVVSDLTSINSQQKHIVINSCINAYIRNVKVRAPGSSPNTDGIYMQASTGVTITGSTLTTGDDCIAIGQGTKNVHMSSIKCGPGHGISIGSLGQNAKEAGVENITLSGAVFTSSDNGVRIKTWARASTSYVKNVIYQNIQMKNVKNPIIIDQNYCPNNEGCSNKSSGVKITQVTYKNIQGTTATQQAVKFDCSSSNPCRGIKLQDIKLKYLNKPTTSSCKYIAGSSSGVSMPESCL